MAHQNKVTSISLKGFLFLVAIMFAAAGFVLVISLSSAQTGTNVTPASAVALVEESNTGTLNPGEQHWFTFTSTAAEAEKFLTLIFTPDDGNTVKFIKLNIFEESQVEFFSEDETNNMVNFGASQIVSQDDDPDTGEILWSNTVSGSQTYYVQVLNDSDFAIDYSLFSVEISDEVPVEPEVPVQPPTATTADTEPDDAAPVADPVAAAPIVGADPNNTDTLVSGETTRGTVAPHSTYWYSFSFPDLDLEKFKELNYTMFFTPDDGNRRHHVNFELFSFDQFEIWQRGEADKMNNFGAGMLISRDNDYNTGERTWTGSVNKGDKYLLSIANGADVAIDYWLFDDNIINPILGPKPVPAAAPAFAQGAAPQTALPLEFGVNKGGLDPGEEAFYSFRITDFDDEAFEEMALTMIATPDDGNRIRRMTFDVFTAGGVQNWSPGDNSQIHNLGAGSIVYRDNNILTGERVWKGWVIDNELYYVQIRNGTDVHMDYWLFTGDVYGAELGPKRSPVAQIAAAPGKAPSAAESLKVDVNNGKLKPGEEQWYTFSRGDVDASGSVETVFTMIFTPDDGNRIRKVNFQLFEGNQLRDWAPDNRFNLVSFGQGSAVSRDGGFETGELLWKGHVIAGDIYYMRISNESDVTIDYQIFPDDVIKANLD